MSKRRYRPEEIIVRVREADVLLSQVTKVAYVTKAIEIHGGDHYRWRKEYGGLKVKVTQVKRLRELEKENSRLRKAVSDLPPDKMIPQQTARGDS